MSFEINKVAVIGSGVMGSQIAGMLAGLGFDVTLLDIIPLEKPSVKEELLKFAEQAPEWRNKLALGGLEKLKTLRPSPLFRSQDVARIKVGNLDDDLDVLRSCDWIVEVVIERLIVKQKLFENIEPYLKPSAIVSSNTSGIAVSMLTEGRSENFKKNFLVTHFFNPPRYLKLLELVPGKETAPELMQFMSAFAEERLGKGVVLAKDTPNFIANRIGVYHFLDVMHLTEKNGWPLEAVDLVMGIPTGRPKSAVFRTADIVGLDTLSFVAETVVKSCPHDLQMGSLRIPQFVMKMINKGWTGQKSGQGFYSQDKATKAIKVIDPQTLDYRAKANFSTPALQKTKGIGDARERLRQIVFSEDQAGEIAWPAISHVLVYAAERIPEIADDVVQVDRAMRWGFGWDLGPFEMWDALGVEKVVERLAKDGVAIPEIVKQVLQTSEKTFYRWDGAKRSYFTSRGFQMDGLSAKQLSLPRLKEMKQVVEQNSGASLFDVGDGVFLCEFHTKMNAIDGDIIEMLNRSLNRVQESGTGLIIGNQGEHFCAGANLLLVVMAAQQKRWGEIDEMVSSFQKAMQRIRFFPKPVVIAPFGMTLGGGCEVALSGHCRVASIENYVGLVEMGAGVIPAGGGCKNMLLHYWKQEQQKFNPKNQMWMSPTDGGPFQKVRRAFELIGTAKVSASALEAQDLGFYLKNDVIVLNQDDLLQRAKEQVLKLAPNHVPPVKEEKISLPGLGGAMALMNGIRDWKAMGKVTDYDEVVAGKLAWVLAGGNKNSYHLATEDDILQLEREAFLSLCGEERTQARMLHLLQTGKPLRN